jgi:hypothetical protein
VVVRRTTSRVGSRARSGSFASCPRQPTPLAKIGFHHGLLVDQFDYDYLYNGVLQHSDASYSERLLADYTSGELNYILVKHVLPLGTVHKWLEPWYRLAVALTFPKLGPL